MNSTRRDVLRLSATAVVGGLTRWTSTASAGGDRESNCSQNANESNARTGFVFFPETYRECVPFQLGAVLRVFRTRVGRGDDTCRSPLREFVAYEIGYRDESDETSALLAVPLDDEQESPPHEYYLPGTWFVAIDSGETYTLQTACDEPSNPVQSCRFAPVV